MASAVGNDKGERATSSFTWNDVVFQSFQAGYIKQLDLVLYRQLKSSIAKRIFRFLDKRFYHRSEWDFPLVEFACEHIGVSRNYDAAQLKRCLMPAIEELEQVGFLRPMTAESRFLRVSRGNWRAFFARPPKRAKSEPVQYPTALQSQMIARGVTPRVAAQIAATNPPEAIEDRLAVFDVLVAANDPRVSRNPAGYLVASIRKNYATPRSLPHPSPQTSAKVGERPRRRHTRLVTPSNTSTTNALRRISTSCLRTSLHKSAKRLSVTRRHCSEKGASGRSPQATSRSNRPFTRL